MRGRGVASRLVAHALRYALAQASGRDSRPARSSPPSSARTRNTPRCCVVEAARTDAFPMSDETSAPLARRLAALLYDALLLSGLLFVFTLVLIFARGGRAIAAGTLWYEASLVAVAFAFCGLSWTRGGQTRRHEGLADPRRRARCRARSIGRAPRCGSSRAGCHCCRRALGYWWALVDRERCCWHDRLSGTRVIRASAARGTRFAALSGPSRRESPSRLAARRSAPKRRSQGPR